MVKPWTDKGGSMAEVISTLTYKVLDMCRARLHDEVVNNYYWHGKGASGSPSKILRSYGFQSKGKKKLLKEVTIFLQVTEVVDV